MSNMTENQYLATWEHYTCVQIAGALYQLGLTPNKLHKQYSWVPWQDAEWFSVIQLHTNVLWSAALHTMLVLVSPIQMWIIYEVQHI
jgi:hypothetical protein